MSSDPRPGTTRRVPRQDANLERRLELLFKATRTTDPGPRPTEPEQDKELEQRLEALFGVIGGMRSPRPTDLPSLLTWAGELHDRLNSAR